jgi:hypothetical protein
MLPFFIIGWRIAANCEPLRPTLALRQLTACGDVEPSRELAPREQTGTVAPYGETPLRLRHALEAEEPSGWLYGQ